MTTMMRKAGLLFLIVSVLFAFSPLVSGTGAYGKTTKLNKKNVVLQKGKTCKLKVKGTKKKVKWSSSDTKVVKVSKKGKVTGKGYGDAVITAKVKGKKLTCKVKVVDKYSKKAYNLRALILKKKGKAITYYKQNTADEEEYYRITAFKNNYKLEFEHYSGSDLSEGSSIMKRVTIDLVNNKEGEYLNSYSSDVVYSPTKGKIRRNFTKDGKGVDIKEYYTEDKEDGTRTDFLITDSVNADAAKVFFDDFSYYNNKLLKKKAKGYTMQNIGFFNV